MGGNGARRATVAAAVACCALSTVAFAAFRASLAPFSDVDDLHAHLMGVSVEVLASAAIYAVCVCASLFLPRLHRGARLSLAAFVVLQLVWLTVTADRGGTPEAHGVFNLYGFWLVFVGVFALGASICASLKTLSARRCCAFWAFLLVLFFVPLLLTTLRGYSRWPKGLYGRALVNSPPLCHVERPLFVWEEFFPAVAVKPFLDRKCIPPPGIVAVFRGNQTLMLECQPHKKASFTILPLLRGYTPDYDLQKVVLEKATHVVPNGYPLNISGVESVVARCGDKAEMFVQCQRRESVVARVHRYEAEVAHTPRPRLSVVVLWLDAISRRQLFRTMPTLMHQLESLGTSAESAVNVYQFFRQR
eukprot:TRINITY_DN4445_c0_g2_i1.p1 TRINITY_DN4445_c0_g2~~TRINITY_DN4445_c0_g2_i1.p1  ORF type:complete len:377 (-),score=56.10 TRINITY_DN4445_c0_g2_i1:883-1965(-)